MANSPRLLEFAAAQQRLDWTCVGCAAATTSPLLPAPSLCRRADFAPANGTLGAAARAGASAFSAGSRAREGSVWSVRAETANAVFESCFWPCQGSRRGPARRVAGEFLARAGSRRRARDQESRRTVENGSTRADIPLNPTRNIIISLKLYRQDQYSICQLMQALGGEYGFPSESPVASRGKFLFQFKGSYAARAGQS